jgi:hypothetical protein
MTPAWKYENFLRDAFSYKSGFVIGRGEDPYELADTDMFCTEKIPEIKRVCAEASEIFLKSIFERYSEKDLGENEYCYVKTFPKKFIAASSLDEISSLIDEFRKEIFHKFFVQKKGIISLKKENHPVGVLWGNIITRLESFRSDALEYARELTKCIGIKPGIGYLVDFNPSISPYIDINKKEVAFQENFLAFCWATSYTLFVFSECELARFTQNRLVELDNEEEFILKQNAWKLFIWALGLRTEFSCWPKDLPSPDNYLSEHEKIYGEKVNGIFQDIFVYMFLHEVAHVVNKHEVTQDKQLSVQQEKEADLSARDKFFEIGENETTIIQKIFGIIFTHCIQFFVPLSEFEIRQNSHPDIDIRMDQMIKDLPYPTEDCRQQILHIVCAGLLIFAHIHNVKIELFQAETIDEMYERILSKMDEIKTKANFLLNLQSPFSR